MQYRVSFTSLYTMTVLIVRSSIVHLTPILGCSYHLHSIHRFLSTWGAVKKKTKKKCPFVKAMRHRSRLPVSHKLKGWVTAERGVGTNVLSKDFLPKLKSF